MKSESLVHRIRGDFDWSSLRFPGERTVRTEIERDPILHEMALEHANPRLTLPAGFLRGGLTVTPAITPAIHRVIELLRQVLQLDAKIDVEIVPHTERLVELTPESKPSEMTLRVSAPLLADATLRETLFLLGRKIGHALVGQVRLYRDPAAGRQDARRETLLLRGLWRFQELACDRFGMICCQDLDVAIRALVRQTSGLPMSLLSISREDWLRERPFEDESMISPRENDFLMLRVASLERFVESDKYTGAFDEQWLDAAPIPWNDGEVVEAMEAEVEGDESVAMPSSAAAMVKEQFPRRTEEVDASTLTPPAWESPSPFVLPTVEKGQQRESIPTEPPVSRNAPISPLPISSDPVIEYRMVGDDPSVVEQIYTYPTGSAAPKRSEPAIAAAPTSAGADNDSQLRRSFTVHAAFWLVSLQDSVSKLQQSLLVDLFGNQVYSEVRPGYEQFGDEVFAKFCRESAGKMRQLDRATRQDMLRELTRIMMTDNGDLPRSEPVLQEIADLLGLVRDDMTMALSEFVDPEYADYTFHPGELVDVHLDGEWVTGVVESVDADSGDIRVRFTASGKALRLHPLADLIRPKQIKQAS